MQISELKTGDILYFIRNEMVFSYIYVGLHYKSDCYYLVIDKTLDKPLRIYKDELQRVLDLNLFTYRDALVYLRQHLVDYIKDVDQWIIQTEIRAEKLKSTS